MTGSKSLNNIPCMFIIYPSLATVRWSTLIPLLLTFLLTTSAKKDNNLSLLSGDARTIAL
jgi:hypothetical protein